MPSFLVLDSEAVKALVEARDRAVAPRRAKAVLAEAARRNALVRIPSAVLAKLY